MEASITYPMEQERILAYVQDRQDLIRQPWAKRADKIEGEDAAAQQAPVLLGMNWPNEKCTGFDSVKSMMNNKFDRGGGGGGGGA